ncbi:MULTISPECIES: TIGR00730 family Rossman fold protein [Streptomyces]|uniref:Cytokinin riboside 5'-monophosphate phosphoribohydrolase n=1 Tax=Streptomyces lonegramiae TaxID=3075524 RepID=A0ABU2XQJ4_9ACTN|nr:TIGR00730 family Rossman fold protein [Streptomyces sp. DSM 41529]MDT0548193.1 TIGR00730 family Rossman fold protein [Streptomyces sp. DSM 41529]
MSPEAPLRRVTVFCGASSGCRPVHLRAAAEFGRAVAETGLELVYGGARVGLMGAVADAALRGGAAVTGVIPRHLERHEISHTGLTRLLVVADMHQRKARMAELGDAFVALPGGLGTAEEIFEALTWAQIGLHDKPCALLDTGGYYQPLLAFLAHAAAEGFVSHRDVDGIVVCARPGDVLPRLAERRRLRC